MNSGLTFDRFLKRFDEEGTISTDKDVNHPDRYIGASVTGRMLLRLLGLTDEELQAECIDFIEFNQLNFVEGSLVKYLWRVGEKGSAVSCLRKAKWYAARQLFNQTRPLTFCESPKSTFGFQRKTFFDAESLYFLIKEIDRAVEES